MRLVGALVLAVMSMARPSAGQTVNVRLDDPAPFSALGLSENELEQIITDQVRALYGVSDLPTFLRLSANAQSLVSRGLGVDYASNPSGFLFGVAVSGALDAGDADLDELDDLRDFDLANFDRAVPIGVGAQISLMVGYNFKAAGLPELTLYANGMVLPLTVGVEAGDYSGDFRNFGVHAQYKLVRPFGNVVFSWGGLDVTSGLQFSEMVLDLGSNPLRTSLPISANGVEVDVSTVVETGRIELVQTAWTVPIEVTTNVRFLYVLSLFGGFGLDLNFGRAALRADIQSQDIRAGGQTVGAFSVSADDDNGPTTAVFRFLFGAQVHLGPIKVFGQLNVLTEQLALGGAAGLRFLF
ncbi:MAG: hypothetical protein HC923_07975 [Myxococcales bacterium]|nr:hypothetical protein [Myxococcales bacterium]